MLLDVDKVSARTGVACTLTLLRDDTTPPPPNFRNRRRIIRYDGSGLTIKQRIDGLINMTWITQSRLILHFHGRFIVLHSIS